MTATPTRAEDVLDLAALTPEAWDVFCTGYATGLAHGREAAERAHAEAEAAVWAEACQAVRNASTLPLRDPSLLTATSAELRQRAEARERAGIERFRAAVGREVA